jgi:PBP1b-binding outer membrane lipoprotein LpoB
MKMKTNSIFATLIIASIFAACSEETKVNYSTSPVEKQNISTSITATGTIEQEFLGNTSYTLKMNLTPSTRGLEISLVQSAFTPWQSTIEGTHVVYNW